MKCLNLKMAATKKTSTKSSRSDIVSVRLDPKLKYLAEIGARTQRRSLSSFIEWAIEKALTEVPLKGYEGPSIASYSQNIWDIDEADRLAKLAFHAPELMTFEEQAIWKLTCELPYIFWGNSTTLTQSNFYFYGFRECFQKLKEAADGNNEAAAEFFSLNQKIREENELPF